MKDKNEVTEGALSTKEILGELFPYLRKDTIERRHRLVSEITDFWLFFLAIFIGIVGNIFVGEMFRLGEVPITSPLWWLDATTFAISAICILGASIKIYLIIEDKQKQIRDINQFLNFGLKAYISEESKKRKKYNRPANVRLTEIKRKIARLKGR